MIVLQGSATPTIRPYTAADEEAVLQLLGVSLGGGPAGTRSAEFFRWKHLENPFGRSLMLVADVDDRIVGFRAFMRWQFTTGDRVVTAVRAVDTATHPDYRGRGIFSALTLAALDGLRSDVDLVFNTPNDKSMPGYLKMGWLTVGTVPIRIRIVRPVRFARRWRSLGRSPRTAAGAPLRVTAPSVSGALSDAERPLHLPSDPETFPGRLATRRDAGYLRWRYGSPRLLDYRAIANESGLAIFRVRPRASLVEATLSELVVTQGDVRHAQKLLRAVARAASVDHVAMSFSPRSTSDRAVRRGTFRAPAGMILVAKPLRGQLDPDPARLSSWALALGDLEVF